MKDRAISYLYLVSKIIPGGTHLPDKIMPEGYVYSEDIHKAPEMDVEPIVNSQWLLTVRKSGKRRAECGECGYVLPIILTDSATGRFKAPKRCAECGAHMMEVIEQYD